MGVNIQMPNITARMQQLRQSRQRVPGNLQAGVPNLPKMPIQRPGASQPGAEQMGAPANYQSTLNQFNQQMTQVPNQGDISQQFNYDQIRSAFAGQQAQAETNQSPAVPGLNQHLSQMAGRMAPPPQEQATNPVSDFIRNALQEGYDQGTILQFITGRIGLQAPGAGRVGKPVEARKQ